MSTALTFTPEQQANLAAYSEDLAALSKREVVVPKNPQEAAAVSEFLSQVVHLGKNVKALRDAVREPLKAKLDAVDATFKPFTLALELIASRLKPAIAAWHEHLEAEERRQREQQERLQREAAEKEAAEMRKAEEAKSKRGREAALARARDASVELAVASAAVIPATRAIRTESGTVSTRKEWTWESLGNDQEINRAIADVISLLRQACERLGDRMTDEERSTIRHSLSLIPVGYLCLDDAHITKAVRSGVRDVPGLNIFQRTGVGVRT